MSPNCRLECRELALSIVQGNRLDAAMRFARCVVPHDGEAATVRSECCVLSRATSVLPTDLRGVVVWCHSSPDRQGCRRAQPVLQCGALEATELERDVTPFQDAALWA